MDSYDKLKPYGICINGCIDGFSRHIIWLRLGRTSSDPKVIAGYYLDAVRLTGGCPKTVRSDMGTENGLVERIQKTFHQSFNTERCDRPSFLYGKSTHNQRIGSWWGMLRKHCVQFWMNLFQSLKDENFFQGTTLDKMLIQFCFSKIIEREMVEVVHEWNIHKISKTRNSVSPTGRPALMYEVPSFYGAQSYLVPVPAFAIDELSSGCTFQEHPCDKDFHELCIILIEENQYVQNENPTDCVDLYKKLRNDLRNIFNITI
ncbi:unnamed protein product [Ceutorhynchus assimilis]|uniref:Integrase core domain-containing protein n=1 Tax=Ceutorhynchus assimilis TaxID=467358 RepID=A0A9N9QLC0_9CUCU|nr:unnamed protein product [Ceutorhynchus assimilis]